MHDRQTVLSLIGQIYEAAVDRNGWPTFVEALNDAQQSASTTLIVHDGPGTDGGAGFAVRFDQSDRQGEPHEPNSQPPSIGAQSACGETAPLSAGTSGGAHIFGVGETLHCNHADRAREIVVGSGRTLIEDTVSYAILMRRPARVEPFANGDLQLLHVLMPHLERALNIHRRTARLELQWTTSTQALNLLEVGFIVTDAHARVLTANRAARLIVDEGDGLSTDHDRLAAATPGQTRALHALIGEAAETTRGEYLDCDALALSRPSLKPPLNVLVMPLGLEGCGLAALRPSDVALFVSDPTRTVRTDQRALRRWYGLTAAEAELASRMAAGRTIQEIATELAISWNTARWHLKHVYAKTRTAGQGQLMRLLLTSPARLGRRSDSPLPARRRSSRAS